jgi:hypothetical protein
VRALILVLCAVVVVLTVPVLLHAGGTTRATIVGERFHPGVLLFDARVGEEATYRDQEGNTLVWRVTEILSPEGHSHERLRIVRRLLDRTGRPMSPQFGEVSYEHDFIRHGWFPLMAPLEPEGLDRLWIWARIRQEKRSVRGKEWAAWRVDFIDPALEPGADEVRTWFHPEVPVFGLLEWHHYGRTWTLVASQRGERR